LKSFPYGLGRQITKMEIQFGSLPISLVNTAINVLLMSEETLITVDVDLFVIYFYFILNLGTSLPLTHPILFIAEIKSKLKFDLGAGRLFM